MSVNVRVLDDPREATIHMAALISDAYLHKARVRHILIPKSVLKLAIAKYCISTVKGLLDNCI